LRSEKKRQLELALQQARYEAARAQRQYDVADPENRLVAGELERRWNERLVAVHNLEVEIDRLDAETEPPLTEADRERLIALGQDLVQAWESPGATSETRKKIIRAVISEIHSSRGLEICNWSGRAARMAANRAIGRMARQHQMLGLPGQ